MLTDHFAVGEIWTENKACKNLVGQFHNSMCCVKKKKKGPPPQLRLQKKKNWKSYLFFKTTLQSYGFIR